HPWRRGGVERSSARGARRYTFCSAMARSWTAFWRNITMRWWRIAGHPAVVQAGGLWALLRKGQLAFRLLRDERGPLAVKLVIPASLLYLISPLDLIPDFIPVVGQVDDITIVLLAVLAFVKMAPTWIVAEHEAAMDGRPAEPAARTAQDPIDATYS